MAHHANISIFSSIYLLSLENNISVVFFLHLTQDVKINYFLRLLIRWNQPKYCTMKELPEIPINRFQLAVLLDELEKHFYNFVLENLVYCIQCRGFAAEGVEVETLFLDSLNDIRVEGRCRKCGGRVARLFEFGAKKVFNEKAHRFRKSISE